MSDPKKVWVHPNVHEFYQAAFLKAHNERRKDYLPIEHGVPPLYKLLTQFMSTRCAALSQIVPESAFNTFMRLLNEFNTDVATPIDESYAKFLTSVNKWEHETCEAIIREKAAIEEAVKAQRAAEAAAYAARVKQDYPALLQKELLELAETKSALVDLDSAVNFLKQPPLNKEVLKAAEEAATQYRAKIVYLTETIKRRQDDIAYYAPA
jgi:hypothetical protein